MRSVLRKVAFAGLGLAVVALAGLLWTQSPIQAHHEAPTADATCTLEVPDTSDECTVDYVALDADTTGNGQTEIITGGLVASGSNFSVVNVASPTLVADAHIGEVLDIDAITPEKRLITDNTTNTITVSPDLTGPPLIDVEFRILSHEIDADATVESCIEVAQSTSVNIDVVLDAIPDVDPDATPDFMAEEEQLNAAQYVVSFDDTNLIWLGASHDPGDGSPGGVLAFHPLSAVSAQAPNVLQATGPRILGLMATDNAPIEDAAVEEQMAGIGLRLMFLAGSSDAYAVVTVIPSHGEGLTKMVQYDNDLFNIGNMAGTVEEDERKVTVAIGTTSSCAGESNIGVTTDTFAVEDTTTNNCDGIECKINEELTVTVGTTITNAGPSDADILLASSLIQTTGPSSCDISAATFDPVQPAGGYTVTVDTPDFGAKAVTETYTLTNCGAAGDHTFTANDSVSFSNPSATDPGNPTPDFDSLLSGTVNITQDVDVEVTSLTMTTTPPDGLGCSSDAAGAISTTFGANTLIDAVTPFEAFAGTTTAAGSTTQIVDSGGGFPPDDLVGYALAIASGPADGEVREISANTDTTITVFDAFTDANGDPVAPGSGAVYVVGLMGYSVTVSDTPNDVLQTRTIVSNTADTLTVTPAWSPTAPDAQDAYGVAHTKFGYEKNIGNDLCSVLAMAELNFAGQNLADLPTAVTGAGNAFNFEAVLKANLGVPPTITVGNGVGIVAATTIDLAEDGAPGLSICTPTQPTGPSIQTFTTSPETGATLTYTGGDVTCDESSFLDTDLDGSLNIRLQILVLQDSVIAGAVNPDVNDTDDTNDSARVPSNLVVDLGYGPEQVFAMWSLPEFEPSPIHGGSTGDYAYQSIIDEDMLNKLGGAYPDGLLASGIDDTCQIGPTATCALGSYYAMGDQYLGTQGIDRDDDLDGEVDSGGVAEDQYLPLAGAVIGTNPDFFVQSGVDACLDLGAGCVGYPDPRAVGITNDTQVGEFYATLMMDTTHPRHLCDTVVAADLPVAALYDAALPTVGTYTHFLSTIPTFDEGPDVSPIVLTVAPGSTTGLVNVTTTIPSDLTGSWLTMLTGSLTGSARVVDAGSGTVIDVSSDPLGLAPFGGLAGDLDVVVVGGTETDLTDTLFTGNLIGKSITMTSGDADTETQTITAHVDTTITVNNFVGTPAALDTYSMPADTLRVSAITRSDVFPTNLLADAQVGALIGGSDGDPATAADNPPIWYRYVGIADTVPNKTPVNSVGFFLGPGSGYASVVVTGDPDVDAPFVPVTAVMCAPMVSESVTFDSVGGTTLRQCDSEGTKWFSNKFVRSDTGGSFDVYDSSTCTSESNVGVTVVMDDATTVPSDVNPDSAEPRPANLDGDGLNDREVTVTTTAGMEFGGNPTGPVPAGVEVESVFVSTTPCEARSDLENDVSLIQRLTVGTIKVDRVKHTTPGLETAESDIKVLTYDMDCTGAGTGLANQPQVTSTGTALGGVPDPDPSNDSAFDSTAVTLDDDTDSNVIDPGNAEDPVVLNIDDNCPFTNNEDQEDAESDLTGNACDTDDDNDSVADTAETLGCSPGDDTVAGDDTGPNLAALSASALLNFQEDIDGDAGDDDGCRDIELTTTMTVPGSPADVDVSTNLGQATVTVTNEDPIPMTGTLTTEAITHAVGLEPVDSDPGCQVDIGGAQLTNDQDLPPTDGNIDHQSRRTDNLNLGPFSSVTFNFSVTVLCDQNGDFDTQQALDAVAATFSPVETTGAPSISQDVSVQAYGSADLGVVKGFDDAPSLFVPDALFSISVPVTVFNNGPDPTEGAFAELAASGLDVAECTGELAPASITPAGPYAINLLGFLNGQAATEVWDITCPAAAATSVTFTLTNTVSLTATCAAPDDACLTDPNSSNDTAVKTITVDKDTDADGVADLTDNCIDDPNGPLLGPNNQLDTDSDGKGDVCDAKPTHDVEADNLDRGLSIQTVSTYVPVTFEVTADVVNASGHDELVDFDLILNKLAMPDGCTASRALTSPGSDTGVSVLAATPILNVTYDVTINCSEGTPFTSGSLGITFEVTHDDAPDGAEPAGNLDNNTASDSVSITVI